METAKTSETSGYPTELGMRVRERRKALAMSQVDLAAACGVDQSTISDIERGADCRSQLLLRLAIALQVDAQWLLTGTSAPLAWPLPNVQPDRLQRLSAADLGYVERRLQQALDEVEARPFRARLPGPV